MAQSVGPSRSVLAPGARVAAALLLAFAPAALVEAGPWGDCAVLPGDLSPGARTGTSEPVAWKVTGDGQVGVADVVVALRAAVGLQRPTAKTACGWLPGDLSPGAVDASTSPPTWTVQGDGTIDVADVVVLLRSTVGLVQIAPLEDRLPVTVAPFDSCSQLEAWIESRAATALQENGTWAFGWWGPWWSVGSRDVDSGSGGGPVPASGSESAPSHSTTNVQIDGIDEADLVETDGSVIYSMAGDVVHVTRAWPAASAARIASIPVEGAPHGLYLRDGQLAVVTQGARPDGYLRPESWLGAVKVASWDVSDPAAPVLEREAWFDGWLVGSRMIGERLHLVVYQGLVGPTLPPWTGDAAWLVESLRRVEAASLEDWLPAVIRRERAPGGGWTTTVQPAFACDALVRAASEASALDLTSVLTHEPFTTGSHDGASIAAQGVVTSVSQKHVFVGEPTWDGATHRTRVHAFRIGVGTRPVYRGSGSVPGGVPDQFAMDEWRGALRVASSLGWPGETAVHVLVPNAAGDYEVTGAVTGIAPGEIMQSVRFVEGSCYLVTYRQIDPLFAIDVSDPRAPRVLGELEVTGFSSYLHPLDGGRLIGVGPEFDASGFERLGTQVSLYDVSTAGAPTMLQRDLTPDAWSEVDSDHHAFTWSAAHGALAIPTSSWTPAGMSAGVTLVAVRGNALERLGTLDANALDPTGDWWGCHVPRRTVFLGDVAYAVADAGIVAAPLADLAHPVAVVSFPSPCDAEPGGVGGGPGGAP